MNLVGIIHHNQITHPKIAVFFFINLYTHQIRFKNMEKFI